MEKLKRSAERHKQTVSEGICKLSLAENKWKATENGSKWNVFSSKWPRSAEQNDTLSLMEFLR